MSTLLHRIADWADESPNDVAQKFKKNGEWHPITVREMCDRVFYLALYLESRGFGPKDTGCILSYNCPEWVHMDLAPSLLKGKSAGIYPNSSAKDIHYIIEHTETRFLVVQNKEYFQKITGKNNEKSLPSKLELVLVFDGDTSVHPKAVAYQTAIEDGERFAKNKKFRDYVNQVERDSGSFLIYTSGTTGNPKGALISHDNLVWTAEELAIKFWDIKRRQKLFSFLPLCHVAEKIQNLGVGMCSRGEVWFCTQFEKVATEITEVQPNLLLSVPRLWEKMMEGVEAKLAQATGLKKKMAAWAFATGKKAAEAKFNQGSWGLTDAIQLKLADKLVLSKVRRAMGLGEVKVCASGAAALGAHISKWFRTIQLEILEDFGQTESTGIICMTLPGKECAGTVGKPLPGTEFKLAEDGEILTKGLHVFKGYFKNADATAETVINGWLHTGDLGGFDDRGYLKIRGRKKEIIKTSGGKMVAPLPIEEQIKAAQMISQACMVGDGRKYLSILVTLSELALKGVQEKTSAIKGQVIVDPEVVDQVRKVIDDINSKLASFEKIKQFRVLAREFSVDTGEMTPTLKMKRNVIEANFKSVIDEMYGE